MQKTTGHTGTAVVLRRSNIDTDQIIPAVWMKRVERDGYGPGLFQRWRREPGFPLDDPTRAGASVLVAGPNFGCGSSRQHAVWALRDGGFRAVVSTRIADIHRTNLPLEGLIPVEADEDTVARLMAAVEEDPATTIAIDVATRTLRCERAGLDAVPFRLDETARHGLLNGLDAVGVTLEKEEAIHRYENARQPWLPAGKGSDA